MIRVKKLELRDTLKEFLQFRVYVKFNDGNKRHIFGREWPPGMTLDQIVWKHVVVVTLDRYRGYKDLIDAVETGFIAGKYKEAIIFQRDHTKKFNIRCREYKNGQLNTGTVNDPCLGPDEQILILHPNVDELEPSLKYLTAEAIRDELKRKFINNENNRNQIPAD